MPRRARRSIQAISLRFVATPHQDVSTATPMFHRCPLANPGGGNEAEMALDITAVSLVPTVLPLRIVAVHLGI